MNRETRKLAQTAIIETLAFMSYNPSIGRVLEKDGVSAFEKMANEKDEKLRGIKTPGAFEEFHAEWIREFRSRIRTSKDKHCSYGQAQKAINVYLKVYVDHARLPDVSTAKRLRRFLHVPLDSLLMKTIRKWSDAHGETAPPKSKNSGLSNLDKRGYRQWQDFFKQKHADKPVLFDVVWWLARNKNRLCLSLRRAKTAHEQTAIKRQIATIDKQIDRLVCELYGLTENEIRIAGGKRKC